MLVLTLVAFPFLYAAFPTSWFWNDGRYAIGLTPVVALVVVGPCWQVMRPATAIWVAARPCVAAFATTLVAFNSGYGAIGSPGELTQWSTNPIRPSPRWHVSSSTWGRPMSTRAIGWRTT